MAKKDKKNKKAVDVSWEDEIPAVEPLNQNLETTEEKPSEPAVVSAADLDEEFGGGLLGAIRKNANKKKTKKGGRAEHVEEEAPASTKTTLQSKPATEVTEIDDDEFEPLKKGKKGQQVKFAPASVPSPPTPLQKDEDEDDDGTGDGEVRIKSKKEKEREKKEREKQRKKEQAARKKAVEPTKPVAPPASAAESATAKVESKPLHTPAADTGGKKKVIAAIQKQQELLRKQEEERKRLEKEERERQEEEERQRLEEEKRKEEAKARKKQKDKEKKEQLRKEGKLLTKSQLEAQRKQQIRLKQLIDSGMVVEGLQDPEAKKKKPVYDKKRRPVTEKLKQEGPSERELPATKLQQARLTAKNSTKEEEQEQGEEEEEEEEKKTSEDEAAAKVAIPEDGDLIDDWEKAVDSDGNIKENWDDASEEEADEKEEGEELTLAASKVFGKPTLKAISVAKPPPQLSKEANDANPKLTSQKPVSQSKAKGSESEDETENQKPSATKQQLQQKRDEAAIRRQKQLEQARAAASEDNLRSPICCILGHVDTGKTKLLDKIRQTNVQEGEAGGITQQIGATYFPVEAIQQKTAVVNQDGKMEFKIPGLLVIDTPGHESFTNLRSRGSSLCNIAILVVDIMHGLEQQTLESIQLLRDRKTPFIVALNKIDRLYDWKPIPNNGFQDSLSKQKKLVQAEFQDRLNKTKLAFSEQGLNAEVFYENKNMSKYVSLVPTSAHTGEGIPDMLKLLVKLTQERMAGKLMYLSEIECTVLEVKVIEGLGTTIDVILSNGILREGDRIVLCGLNGAISTNIRALLTPQPLRELRIKSQYVHNKEVKAALGVKIAANDLEQAIAGSRLLVCGPGDDEEELEMEVMSDLENLLSRVSTTGKGVAVQASTLGSLEALLEFLRVSKIPVSTIGIGPIFKRDVMRAGTMLEKNKEFAVMLCFDVKIDKEAQQYADEVGVKIFTANIIYHLFDAFTAYQKEMLEQRRRETADLAVYPCVLSPVQVFNKKDPIVIGVDVTEGSLRIGTPVAVVKPNATGEREVISLGRVTSIELNHKPLPIVKKGQPSVAVKIEGPNQPLYGRHLDEKDTLYALISRKSIDTLKEHFREEVSKEDWALIVQLKKVFNIT